MDDWRLAAATAGLLAALAAGSAGCATASTLRQTARTTPEGAFRASAGVGMPVATRFVGAVLDAADRARGRLEAGETLSEAERRDLEEQALVTLLYFPTPMQSVELRYGLAERWDVGLRFEGAALRLDGKFTFRPHEGENGLDLAVMLGLVHHTDLAPNALRDVADVFDLASAIDYGRQDVEVGLLASSAETAGTWIGWYAAVRYTASLVRAELAVDERLLPPDDPARRLFSDVMHVAAATGGVRLGPTWLQAQLELTVAYAWFAPRAGGRRFDLGGWVLLPALGIALETADVEAPGEGSEG